MSHFARRIDEIIAASPDPEAARARIEDPSRPRFIDDDEPLRVAHDPLANADHFFPTIWATETIHDARKRARKKGIEFRITVGWILKTLQRQHDSCAVSGIAFSAKRPRASHKRPWMPSLDRIDCTKGYTPDNVRIVCVAVNTLLQDWGDSVFHEIIAASRK